MVCSKRLDNKQGITKSALIQKKPANAGFLLFDNAVVNVQRYIYRMRDMYHEKSG